jgi:hypothetical protein
MPEIFDFENEVESIDKAYADYPDVGEVIRMCLSLGIRQKNFLAMKRDDAWAYYNELKAKIEDKRRKSA